MLSLLCLTLVLLGATGQRLSFIAIGDWGTGTQEQRDVANAMNQWAGTFSPQFILTTGDNFYPEGIEGNDDFRWNEYWRNVYTGANIGSLQWEVTLGNHDYYPTASEYEWNQVNYTDSRYHLPHLWHSFYKNSSLGLVHFVIIDSQALRHSINDVIGQLSWVSQQLANSQGAMKIVIAHHPIYSSGRHGPGSSTLRREILPLLEQHNVDIFLCGHDHNLQHLRRLDGTPIDFLLSGGGGRSLYAEDPLNVDILREEYGVERIRFFENFGIMGFTVDEGANFMRIQYINEQNQLVYDLHKRPGQPATEP